MPRLKRKRWKHSEETKRKFSKIAKENGFGLWMIGKKQSKETIEKRVSQFRSKKRTEESKKKMSEAQMGNTNFLGKHHSEGTKIKMSLAKKGKSIDWVKGDKNPNWKGGISPINQKIRMSLEYKDWRIKVFERDNYTCQECGGRGLALHADHIKPFAYFPELRLVIDNGRTLCKPCHKKTDSYAGKAQKNYKVNQLFI